MSNNIFTTNILNTVIQLLPAEFNNSIDDILLEKLKHKVEGKCDKNGYIKPNSVSIIRRSMGKVLQGHFNGSCSYRISYKVEICNPVEGMMVKAIVRNINKMGLFCELHDIDPSPLSIILAKQHHLKDEAFVKIKVNDVVNIEVIGIKFNYNDTQISCIGRLSSDGKTFEENQEYSDEEKYEEEEMDLGETMEEPISKSSPSLSKGGGKTDIISMVGAKINNEEAEEDTDENLELNLVDLNNQDEEEVEVDINEDLGLDFEGEVMDLDEVSRRDTEPLLLNENAERPRKLTDEVFKLEPRENSSYKPFIKKPNNKINYHIYLTLTNLFIDFYEKYGVRPKKLSLSTRNKYYKSIKNYMKINASSYEIQENGNRTFIC
jgi:DNA-directed RNA polymerase subunit E'/Rpb7